MERQAMSNSQNMTLEERIVQKLKSDTLMELVGDEDAITTLVTRAINEALFKERDDGNYYHPKKVPSPVMNAAEHVAKRITADAVTKFLADEKTMQLVDQIIAAEMPRAIQAWLRDNLAAVIDSRAGVAANTLVDYRKSMGTL
jgi:hypothetical protein